jgi:two-component sensor histidine kinase
LSEASKLDVVPGATGDVSRHLLPRPEAAAAARRALVGLALPTVTRENLALLVTELVANSVRHAELRADDFIHVGLTAGSDTVRLSVHDGGHGFVSEPPDRSDPLTPGGRGLVIVDALSETWGVDSDAQGCTVWCELAVEERPPAAEVGHVHELALALA